MRKRNILAYKLFIIIAQLVVQLAYYTTTIAPIDK